MIKKRKKINDDKHYRSIPALAAYIDRIGAEQLNFRRFMVKEHKGHYYTEKSLIIIRPDFSITSSKKEYRPTDEEAAAIKEALVKVSWPKAISAKTTDGLRKISGATKENLFEFFNRASGEISFVQEKRTNRDGTKSYLPWTFFSDGKWRMMEPDGALPFWKPRERTSAKIMIHEGAKAARYVNWLVSTTEGKKELKVHPFGEELKDYEHWGMIGGALAPHRADYEELKREKPIDVVYICDNDWPGKKAIEDVSQHWGGSLKGVFFDERWPMSWDMADPFSVDSMPRLFAKTGRYIGPSLDALQFSATFATELVPNPSGEGRPIIAMRKTFLEEWFHCIRPEVFVHRSKPNLEYTLNEFNSIVSPFSHSKETGALVKKDAVHKSGTLCYVPGRHSGTYVDKSGHTFINMHVPTYIKREKGDCALWEEFITSLIPLLKDREEALRWIATLIVHPEIKMHYGMLLISETQGVGKTTLGQDILAPLMGATNVSYPSEQDIVESNFNYWQANKRLAVVNEIYAGHSTKAYDKLKSVITDKVIPVNKKYQSSYEIENWLHIFACSNSMRAIKISDDDRRWFIPRVSEELKPRAYWTAFHEWLDEDNGLGKIAEWCHNHLKKVDCVRTGDKAPWTTVKQEVIEESMSPGMVLVAGLLDIIKENHKGGKNPIFVTDVQLVQLIKDKLHDGRQVPNLERPLTIRKLARAKGWWVGSKPSRISAWGPQGAYVKLLFPLQKYQDLDPNDLYKLGLKPINLNDLIGI